MRSEWPYAEPSITVSGPDGPEEVDTRDIGKPEYFTYETPRGRGRKLNRLRTRVRLGLVNRRYELVGIELFSDFGISKSSDEPEWTSAIQATDVRNLRPGELVEQAIAAHRDGLEIVLHMAANPPTPERPKRNPKIPPKVVKATRASAARLEKHDPRNKAGRPVVFNEDHYREVARVYLEADVAHQPPRAAVAAHFGWHERKATNHIAKARHEYGLIPKTRKDQQ